MLTKALAFREAIGAPSEPIFAGSLAFLGDPETLEVLDDWGADSVIPAELGELSVAAQTSPPPHAALVSRGRVKKEYSDDFRDAPVAAMLCAQIPRVIQGSTKDIACLRLYLLVKAVQLQPTNSIREAAKYVVRFLEERADYPDGVAWIAQMAGANRHFATYETGIREGAKTFKAEIRADQAAHKRHSAGTRFANLLQAISAGKVQPNAPAPSPITVPVSEEWRSALSENLAGESDLQIQETIALAPEDDEEEDPPIEIAILNKSPTPEHRFRLGLGLHLQTQTQRNVLAYSWDRLRPDELESQSRLIERWLATDDLHLQLLGAIACLAIPSRNSIEVTCSMALSSSPSDSRWVLDVQQGRLLRQPNRPGQRFRVKSVALPWVRGLATANELRLSERLHSVLLNAFRRSASKNAAKHQQEAPRLGDLWEADESPQTKFDRLCAAEPGLQRVTHGMLKATADQLVFNATDDAVFTRMLLTPDEAIKPAAGSYAAWTVAATDAALATLVVDVQPPPGAPQTDNGLGSELDPDDRMIQVAFAQAATHLENLFQAQGADGRVAWWDLHNAITIYSVVTLLACTGARPATSIFECLQDFDLHSSQPRVFIDDKVILETRTGRWGRIVPLPVQALELMQKLYLPYFHWLTDRMREVGRNNEDFAGFATALEMHLVDGNRPGVPLFFLFKRAPKLHIVEVSEREIEASGCFAWPLPCNLFRHRLSTRLRSNGTAEEYVAAQLGHSEAGTDVYGSVSPRCWTDDEQPWREALTAAVAPLSIPIINFRLPALTPTAVASNFQRFLTIGRFGSEARQHERASTQPRAQSSALDVIKERIATALNQPGVPKLAIVQDVFPETLTDDQIGFLNQQNFWTSLGRSMLLTDANTPRPNHSIWFQTYEDFCAKLFQDSYAPKRDRILLFRPKTARFAFSRDSLHAERKFVELKKQLSDVFNAVPVYKRPLRLKSVLSALDLALTSFVSDPFLLLQVGSGESKGIQTHVRDGVLYFARHPGREEKHAPAFAWHCVPARTARSLLDVMSSTRKLETANVPNELAAFARKAESALGLIHESLKDSDQLIKKIAGLVDHHNRLELPGIAASVRSGEIASWSLDAYALARAAFGKQVDELKDAQLREPDPKVEIAELETNSPSITAPAGSRRTEESLLKFVRSTLAEFERATKGKNWSDRQRLVAATSIQRELSLVKESVSSSVQLLVSWVLQMLREKGPAGKMLRSSSIRTYIALLAPAFLDHGRDINLLEADEDDIEDFYFKVLTRPVQKASVRQSHEGTERRLDELAVLGRLREFHRFLEKAYGAESPDWSALGEDLTSSQVSAQIITPHEYEIALESLCPPGSSFDHDAYLEAFLLILGYRFGLRSGEAISTARQDLVSIKGGFVVLVSGKHKALKSNAGRRQVPLLGELTPHEAEVVEGWTFHWETLDLQASAPLFPSPIKPQEPTRVHEHRTRVVTALRMATARDRVTFHHARHSFASLMFLRLVAPHLIPGFPGMNSRWIWGATEVQKQLLGRAGVTRRSPWALSLMLGHGHPRTTLVSYCHFAHELANARAMEKQKSDFLLPKSEDSEDLRRQNLDVMAAQAHPAPSSGIVRRPKRTNRTPQDVLRFLETLSRGIRPSRAGWLCDFKQGETDSMMGLLAHLTHEPGKTPAVNDDPVREDSRLGQVIKGPNAQRWQELRDIFANRDLPPLDGRDAIYQVGGPLQILLWLEEHFDTLKDVMNAFGWKQSDLEMFVPPSGSQTSSTLAKEYGWSLSTTLAASGVRRTHVDVARYPTTSKRTKTTHRDFVSMSEQKDRVGVSVRQSPEGCIDAAVKRQPVGLRERADLVRIWLAIHLRSD